MLWAESLLPSTDRCANFPSRERGASGDTFLGPRGEIFLWNKEGNLGRSCCSDVASETLPGELGSPGLQAALDSRAGLWMLSPWAWESGPESPRRLDGAEDFRLHCLRQRIWAPWQVSTCRVGWTCKSSGRDSRWQWDFRGSVPRPERSTNIV